jgi:uncharacterized protein (DUF1501 family)
MNVTRRQFIQGGAAAFTVTFAAPAFLTDLARAQGARTRNFVILYLSGGNDSLSMLMPYNDPFYRSRRPTIAVPTSQVLQLGSDSSRVALGLHPRLSGLKQIFDQGKLALIQRTGYSNSSRSHFQGTDIWSTANPNNSQGLGWLGRYLDSLPSPVDPLIGWNTTSALPHVLQSGHTAVPAIASPAAYSFSSPNSGVEAAAERIVMTNITSHVPINQPEVAFVYGSTQAALATLDRVARVVTYGSSTLYPNTPFGSALKAVAGAMAKGIGTKIFYVTTGGFDNHSGQGVNANLGTYNNLMLTLNDGLFAFYNDLKNQGMLDETLIVSFSEFGRRITENSSQGTDHGAASVMLALGGRVNGGLYGTAPSLNPDPSNPTLENSGADVHYETDFRSVYAQVIEKWLGTDSIALLGDDFRKPSLTFI